MAYFLLKWSCLHWAVNKEVAEMTSKKCTTHRGYLHVIKRLPQSIALLLALLIAAPLAAQVPVIDRQDVDQEMDESLTVAGEIQANRWTDDTQLATLKKQIKAIIVNVNDLVASGALKKHQGLSLAAKLHKAIWLLEKKRTNAAVRVLNGFSQQVEAYVSSGKLDATEGNTWIAAAANVIAQIDSRTAVIRAQVVEALNLAAEVKVAVAEYYASMGQLPVDNQAAGLPSPEQLIGNYVTSLTVENGAVHIALGNQVDSSLAGKQLSLRPATIAANPYGSISWVCGYTSPAAGMTAQGTNRTSVPAMYLPAQCGGPTDDPATVIRAQVVEALILAAEVKVAVAEVYFNTGQLPVDNQAVGLPRAIALCKFFLIINLLNAVFC